jgi:hypothetical protein
LFAAKVPFRRLDAHVAEQELDLFKLPAGFVTQTRACATKIVRSHILQTTFRTPGLHHTPDNLRAECTLPNSLGLVDCAKDGVSIDLGGIQPIIYCRFDPAGNWHGPHVAALADQISDDPMLFPLLQRLHRQGRCLRSPEAATQENGNHGVVTLAPETTVIKGGEKSLALFSG